MKTRRAVLIGCILALGLVSAPAFARQPVLECAEVEYFSATGHNVCDQFLRFFKARGGAEIFGYPITDQFTENDRQVQYFQRVRMEYHPELGARYQVQLGLLGDYLAPADRKARISASDIPKSNDPNRRYFPATGHTVQFSFLRFFNEKGGVDLFGYPVTEFYPENDRVIQYFQRALMEWDPNRDSIVLHHLGEYWIDQHTELQPKKALRMAPANSSNTPAPAVSALYATASVRNAFTGREGDQTVWVYVNDQSGQPVEGAEVTLVALFLPGGFAISIEATDEQGHTEKDFVLPNLTPGQLVILEAQVRYGGLMTRARTFFLAWW